jgi:hypothetical protein
MGHARKTLCKAWKKAAKLGRNLEKLDAERRHEMRKALNGSAEPARCSALWRRNCGNTETGA